MVRRGGLLVLLMTVLLLVTVPTASADTQDFPGLSPGSRVYDQTGRSLSADQVASLQQRLDALRSEAGPDAVVVVRDLDATPEETFDQVEALQQAWVAATGTDQDTAVAILIDRQPGTDDQARAGIYLGSTYDDGSVPRCEQEDIVSETLIPPLRDGDVARSLSDTVERVSDDVRGGAVDCETASFWRTDPGFAAGHLVVVLVGYLLVVIGYRRRPRGTRAVPAPTTQRPDHSTSPWVAGALAFNQLKTSFVPALVLTFAARGALVVEPAPRRWGRLPVLQVRLVGTVAPRDDVESVVWDRLQRSADDGVVSARSLRSMATRQRDTRRLVKEDLRSRGSLAAHRVRARVLICLVGVLALPVALVGFGIGSPWVAAAALVLAPFSWVAAAAYPTLSAEAQDEGRSWLAYRAGLKEASDQTLRDLGLDDLVPFMTALGLSGRVVDVVDRDMGLSPDDSVLPGGATGSSMATFHHTFTPPSSSGGGGFSGGGAGGGGGAAGST